MKPDRKMLERALELLRAQVRELEQLLKKPQVMKRVTFEVEIDFEETPVPEDTIETMVSELESALEGAIENVSLLADYLPDTSVGVASIERDDDEEDDDEDDE